MWDHISLSPNLSSPLTTTQWAAGTQIQEELQAESNLIHEALMSFEATSSLSFHAIQSYR